MKLHGTKMALLCNSELGHYRFVPAFDPGSQVQDTSNTQNTLVETPSLDAPASPSWAMPLQVLDERLPARLQFNAQYRNRVEESGHIGFKPGSDTMT
jgi:hypothetical protein